MLMPIYCFKGFVKNNFLYRDDGMKYELHNSPALENEILYGFFQIHWWYGKWWMICNFITKVVKLNCNDSNESECCPIRHKFTIP